MTNIKDIALPDYYVQLEEIVTPDSKHDRASEVTDGMFAVQSLVRVTSGKYAGKGIVSFAKYPNEFREDKAFDFSAIRKQDIDNAVRVAILTEMEKGL